MKKVQVMIVMMIFSINLIAQNSNKIQFVDSILNINQLVLDYGDDEMRSYVKAFPKGDYTFGILELENILGKEKTGDIGYPGFCSCQKSFGIIEIGNAVGFMAGEGVVVKLNMLDSTYSAKIFYHTDGMKIHKNSIEEDFIKNIEVEMEESTLVIYSNSELKGDGMIRGELVGTSVKYFEKNNSKKGYKEVQRKVLSIFECKLVDYTQMLLQPEKKN